MRLRRLTLTDFLSHNNTVLEFKDQPYVFLGMNFDHAEGKWSNGAGKSSVFYAICWALWGQVPPKTRHKNAVIRRGCDGCQVELHLVGEKGSLQIVRRKSKLGAEQLQAFLNGQRIPGEREETQTKLEAFYGISWDIFCNTVFIGPQSDSARFATAQPAERARLLEEMVNLAPFKEAQEKLSVTQGKVTSRANELKGSLAVLDKGITLIQQTITDLSAKYRMEQASVQAQTHAAETAMKGLEKESLQIQHLLRNPPQGTLPELQAKMNAAQEQLTELEVQLTVIEGKLRMNVPAVGHPCPQCAQPFSSVAAENLGRVRRTLQQEAAVKRSEVSQARAVMAGITGEIQMHRDWVREEKRLKDRLEEIRLTAYQIKGSVESRSLAVLQDEMNKARTQLVDHTKLQTEYREELGKLLERAPVLDHIMKGLKQDVRNMLFDDLRSQLTVYTHRYLEVLAGSDFRVIYPFKTGTGRESFEIEIWAGDSINPLPSVGENYRAVLAILLALRQTLLSQSKSCFDFLLVDDPLFGVDKAGAAAFGKLMNMLALETPQVCVTLPEELEDLPGKTVTIEKTGRISKVLEVR